ncbi:hypothetical protein WJX77_012486 [Trebouxia sp. C0004]
MLVIILWQKLIAEGLGSRALARIFPSKRVKLQMGPPSDLGLQSLSTHVDPAELCVRHDMHSCDIVWLQDAGRLYICRIYTANPTEGERFYLRLLLNHVAGATSFEDMRMYDGTTYDTFQRGCNCTRPPSR